jgi:hypothetical protein
MAIRFNRATEDSWREMIPNYRSLEKNYKKRKGRIMFPTSHDITEENLDNCLIVLKKLIRSKNNILITTKPRLSCVKKICEEFSDIKSLIQFRFTITSVNNDLLNFWEPGASSFKERIRSLKLAFEQGYKTSVSIEPFLDEDPFVLIDILAPYITESIWIGKMNYLKSNNVPPNEKNYYDYIRKINSKINLLNIVERSKTYDKANVRIKDSIFNFIL